VTSRRRPRLPARPLPLLLVGTRLVEIAEAPGPREPPVARLSADLPADPLRLARGRLRGKRRAALGTSAARGHRASVAPTQILAAFSAARWITLRPPGRARSPGQVDHDGAAKWIRGTRPLKHPLDDFSEFHEVIARSFLTSRAWSQLSTSTSQRPHKSMRIKYWNSTGDRARIRQHRDLRPRPRPARCPPPP
jgi:hypothetical protein